MLLYLGYESQVIPAEAQLVSAKDAASGLENEIATLKDLTQSMVVIKDNLKRAQQEMDEIKAKLPEQPDLEGLLASLSDAAKSAGVTITSFEPKEHTPSADGNSMSPMLAQGGGPAPASGGQADSSSNPSSSETLAFKTNIDVKVSGTFSQIVLFYDKTLHFDRIIHLTRFELATSSDQPNNTQQDKVLLNANATFVAYSQLAKAIPKTENTKTQQPQAPQTPQAPTQSAPENLNGVSENRSDALSPKSKRIGPVALSTLKPGLSPKED